MSRLRSVFREALAEIASSKKEGIWLMVMAFGFSSTYSAIRPPTESMFLETFGHQSLPGAWLIGAVVMLAAVEIYSRMVARLGAARMFAVCTAGSTAVLGLLLVARLMTEQMPDPASIDVPQPRALMATTYGLYIFKEVYVILLVEAFWTIANTTFRTRTARWTYGLYCAAGAIGGISGNIAAGVLAGWVGTVHSLWFVVPVLALTAVIAIIYSRRTPFSARPGSADTPASGLMGVPSLLRRSPYLVWMLILISTTQVVITLIDYQYNGAVKAAFPDIDTRTQVISGIYLAINSGSLLLQLGTGALLRFIGIAKTLLIAPVVLGVALCAHLVWPLFAWMAAVKIASKALDYSVFRAAKEILYIPLSYRDQTQGKALVDMFVYRATKGGSYPLIQGITGLGIVSIPVVTLGFIAVWLGVTVRLTGRYQALISAVHSDRDGAQVLKSDQK